MLTANAKSGGDYTPVEEGTYQAVCFSLVDLGTQTSQKFGTSSRKIRVGWEIPEQRINIDGKDMPRTIYKTYTLSLSEKANLRKDLESWRGKKFTAAELDGFDLSKLVGSNCILNVVHTSGDGKTWANVSSISAIMKSMKSMKPETPICIFDLDKPDMNLLSEKMQEVVKQSKEWSSMGSKTTVAKAPVIEEDPYAGQDEEVPF